MERICRDDAFQLADELRVATEIQVRFDALIDSEVAELFQA